MDINTDTNSADQIIIALDFEKASDGLLMVEHIGEVGRFYKIGLGMLADGGLALAHTLKDAHQKRVFLDMKLFDIGATVERAVKGFSRMGLDFLSVHGDPQVVNAAVQGRHGTGLKILAITILTSLERADLDAACIKVGTLDEIVKERATRAFEAGADGVVCSPKEAALLRRMEGAKGKLIVTPGVRPLGADKGDQKRIAPPHQALKNGADYIVIGRPIIHAENPRQAIESLTRQMRG